MGIIGIVEKKIETTILGLGIAWISKVVARATSGAFGTIASDQLIIPLGKVG